MISYKTPTQPAEAAAKVAAAAEQRIAALRAAYAAPAKTLAPKLAPVVDRPGCFGVVKRAPEARNWGKFFPKGAPSWVREAQRAIGV